MDFKELITDYIENGASKVLTEASKKSYLSRLPVIEKFFIKQFGAADHTVLNTSNVRAFQRWRDTSVGNVQKEKETRCFKLMIKRGVAHSLIFKDFSDEIYKYKPAQTKKSKTVVSPEKLEQVLDKAQEYLTPIKYLAFYLSHVLLLRPSELLRIETSDVDIENKEIRIKGTKNETADAVLPLSDRSIELLLPFLETEAKIFPYTYAWLHSIYMRLSDFCGLIDKDITPQKARKNFATYLIAKGVDIKTVQTLGRWSTAKVLLEVYSQPSAKNLREAVTI